MTPEEQERLRQIELKLDLLIKSDRYTFQRDLQFFDGRGIQFAKDTGGYIGREADQKIGFWGKTPIIQPTAPAIPSGGSVIDVQARTWISNAHNQHTNLGLWFV
jgi:hypothetical protein